MSDSLEGENNPGGNAFSLRPFVGTGKKVGETEAFLSSKHESTNPSMPSRVFAQNSAELLAAAHVKAHTWPSCAPRALSGAALGPIPCLLMVQSEPGLSESLHKPFKGYTFYSSKRPIQSSNKRTVKHRKKHLLCAPSERQPWSLKT